MTSIIETCHDRLFLLGVVAYSSVHEFNTEVEPKMSDSNDRMMIK